MGFQVGDWIVQRHQHEALPRLVVGLTDDPNLVRVYCPSTAGLYRKVFTWAHDLFRSATADSLRDVEDHLISEAYAICAAKQHW